MQSWGAYEGPGVHRKVRNSTGQSIQTYPAPVLNAQRQSDELRQFLIVDGCELVGILLTLTYLWSAGNEGMEKKTQTTIMGYIGTTIYP